MSFAEDLKAQQANVPVIPESYVSQTIIVKGLNVSFGLETGRHCFSLGASRVIPAVRSFPKGESAKASVEASRGQMGIVKGTLIFPRLDQSKPFAKTCR